jgi:hypothetical protein
LLKKFNFPRFSSLPFVVISSTLFSPISTKTDVKHTELTNVPVWNTTPNPGVQVEPSLVFLVFQEVALIVVDKVPSPTPAEVVECSTPTLFGEDSTEKSTLLKEDMLWLPQLLPQLYHHSF